MKTLLVQFSNIRTIITRILIDKIVGGKVYSWMESNMKYLQKKCPCKETRMDLFLWIQAKNDKYGLSKCILVGSNI